MAIGVNVSISDNTGSSQRVFVTSIAYGPDFGALSQADTLCATRAAAVSLGGTWKAIISNDSTNAKDRITISGVVRNMLSEKVADDAADFWDGSLDQAILLDESGAMRNVSVWTGSLSDGTKHPFDNCFNWQTVGPAFSGASGGAGQSDAQWIAGAGSVQCTSGQSLYCIDGQ
jgi:hypothetical protein